MNYLLAITATFFVFFLTSCYPESDPIWDNTAQATEQGHRADPSVSSEEGSGQQPHIHTDSDSASPNTTFRGGGEDDELVPVEGRARYDIGGPVVAASVRYSNDSTVVATTDANGYFFLDLPADTFDVVVVKGAWSFQGQVVIPRDTANLVHILTL